MRLVVSECVGRLFANFPGDVGADLCLAMDDPNNLKVSTLVRSFYFSGNRCTNDDLLAQDAWETATNQLI